MHFMDLGLVLATLLSPKSELRGNGDLACSEGQMCNPVMDSTLDWGLDAFADLNLILGNSRPTYIGLH